MTPALIFLHRGYDPYLEFSLRQARASNPNAAIFLIGDASNKHFDFAEHHAISNYHEQATRFAATYQHRATNDHGWMLFCFQRLLIVREFMQHYGLTRVFVCDSDVLVYADLVSFAERTLTGHSLALSIPAAQDKYRWCASAHASYWTWVGIDAFCDFLFESFTNPDFLTRYLEKWDYHVKFGKAGGICEMTALYFFAKEMSSNMIFNTAQAGEDTFDHQINSAENRYRGEYFTRSGMKDIRWQNDVPYGFNVLENRLVRFNTLHFQGNAKFAMYRYYRGPAFAGMTKARYHTYIARVWKGLSRRLRERVTIGRPEREVARGRTGPRREHGSRGGR